MHRIRLWVLLLGVITGCAAGGHSGTTFRSTDPHLLLMVDVPDDTLPDTNLWRIRRGLVQDW
jgi:hypothetical protein